MAIHNKTYHPLLILGISANADLPACRFIAFDGNLCGDGGKAVGVSERAWKKGDDASAIVAGTAVAESSSAISAGSAVTSAADGKARPASAGEPINGWALESVSQAGFFKILLA